MLIKSLTQSLVTNLLAFSPADVEGLQAWFDAADSGTLSLDGSDRVSQWTDKSGKGNSATQSTENNRPTYAATGLNSKPTVQGDGVNDVLNYPNLGINGTHDMTFILVGTLYQATSGFDTPISFGSGSEGRFEWRGVDDPDLIDSLSTGKIANGTDVIPTSPGVSDAVPFVWVLASDSATWTSRKNGTQVASGSSAGTWTLGAGDYGMFASNSPNRHCLCDISEYMVFNTRPTAAEIARLERYAMNKWGVS